MFKLLMKCAQILAAGDFAYRQEIIILGASTPDFFKLSPRIISVGFLFF